MFATSVKLLPGSTLQTSGRAVQAGGTNWIFAPGRANACGHSREWILVSRSVVAAEACRTPTGSEAGRYQSHVRAAQGGDIAARAKLLADFLPLIRSVARNYSGAAALETEEFIQEGVVGLLTALERYDPDLGTPFWAYASWWVRRMMQRLVADLTLPVVLSDRALRQLASVKHARQDHEQLHHCEPSSDEIAETTGYAQDQLDSLMCVQLPARSLDEELQRDDGSAGPLVDLLADPHAEDGYDTVDQEFEADYLRHRPNDLGLRERVVLRARYGFDGPARTLREVGDELDLSAERVRQIQELALAKLQLACSTVLSEGVTAYAGAESPQSLP
jgi:RNA polymerase primary sigma factor